MKSRKKIVIIAVFILLILIGILVYYLINKNAINRKKIDDEAINTGTVNKDSKENKIMYIKIRDKILTVTLENNSSVEALIEKLKQKEITIDMEDYANFEKVGELGFSLPKNDKQITTEPGDIILYQGNLITIYYDTNSWNFTKLGKINDITPKELKEILGDSNVTVTFSLEK